MSRKLQFIFNPSELGAGTRGASLGPEAIRAAARTKGSTLFSTYQVVTIEQQNDLLDHPTPFRYAKYIDGLSTVFASLLEKMENCISNSTLPFLISGDHSAAAGTLAALHKMYPQNA